MVGFIRNTMWIAIWVAVLIFAIANWNPVAITVWPGMLLDTKLPVVLAAVFLAGVLPMWIALRASRWSARRRDEALQSEINQLRAAAVPPAGSPVADPPALARDVADDLAVPQP